MIDLFNSGNYDQEEAHVHYDQLLQEFILKFDKKLLPLMKELIMIDKDFWYA